MAAPMGNLLHERILVEWMDAHSTVPSSLGSCSLANKQAPNFTIQTDFNPETRDHHILLSLFIAVRAAGRTLKREMLLIIPPSALGSNPTSAVTFEAMQASQLGSSSGLSNAVFQEADISDSGRVICVCFDLAAPGFVVMPKTTAKTIKPSTSTSYDLLLGLKSLSATRRFAVYMKYSDYAMQGLRKLHEHWRLRGPSQNEVNLWGMYDGRDAVLVDWNKVTYGNRAETEPPSYEDGPAKPSIEPSAPSAASHPLSHPTYPPTVPQPNQTSTIESGDMLDVPNTPSEILCEIDSDGEEYALQAARKASLEPTRPVSLASAPTPPNLLSELLAWVRGAHAINRDAHAHHALQSKLSALGQYARTNNVAAFDATRAWCSTLLFWDPTDDEDGSIVGTINDLRARDIVADMAGLCRWASGRQRGCEMAVPSVRDKFLRVGKAARAVVASKTGAEVATYEARKEEVIAGVLVAVGRAGTGSWR
ncbi:uncharacterized protein K452DRAFT_291663 [Aplosporella prunicola CBS 121167]|uniref:Uncharacterized protein n=1 Tax=Aplosporella prunicola CBS 121167 TaxID=1176127 RepID=A0A6A6B072_9PEZI|nr:uncharacterized protein K452DRAFT_291663 [Aplosporella prunicola CBS 121167]KAF2137420.1 hypothetical protein K452DRAFT_291663 [Aplosporella prunicola CBS 121167]